jgi:hypothetical protein
VLRHVAVERRGGQSVRKHLVTVSSPRGAKYLVKDWNYLKAFLSGKVKHRE